MVTSFNFTYGRGIFMVTSFNSNCGCSNPYSIFTSQPLPVSFGQQFTEKKKQKKHKNKFDPVINDQNLYVGI